MRHGRWSGFALLISVLFTAATVSLAVPPAPSNSKSSAPDSAPFGSGIQLAPSSSHPPSQEDFALKNLPGSAALPQRQAPESSGASSPASGEPVNEAALRFRSGQYDKALPLFQQQLAASGGDAEAGSKALFHIGQCLTGLHRYAEAITAFDNLLKQFPSSSFADDALLRKGAVQAGFLRKPPLGIATWQQLLQKYPRSEVAPEARFYVGMLQWIDGQKSQAKETWRILVRDFPRDPRSAQAKLYMENKQP